MSTSIEWTDRTWNPTVGCSKVSPGCDHCYAATVARRGLTEAHKGLTAGDDWTGEVRLLPDRLDAPLHWKKPAKVFVDSMSDLFHPSVPDQFIEGVLSVMTIAKHHTFQILTKRPRRMANVLQRTWWDCNGDVHIGQFTADELGQDGDEYRDVARNLPNAWWGTSIENDAYTFRARHLRGTPGRVKFLSLEPLLGPLPALDLAGIDWVILGGESGHGARPMHPAWVRDVRDRCQDAGVPFLFKQWGAWSPGKQLTIGPGQFRVERDGTYRPAPTWAEYNAAVESNADPAPDTGWHGMERLGKKAAGRLLDGRTWDEYPS